MKKIMGNITTGSPILDGVIVGILLFLLTYLFQSATSLPSWDIFFVQISMPVWLLVPLVSLSVIFIKRYGFAPNLKHILTNRRYSLIFNANTPQSKEIEFGSSGKITVGQNDNEYSWRIYWGKLEILGADGKLYSRFRYDKEGNRFLHTNDSDCRSLPNQRIEPLKANTIDWAKKIKGQ